MTLDDRYSMERHNNQLKVGGSDVLEVGATASWTMRGVGHYPIVWAVKVSDKKITNIKHVAALDGRHVIFYTQQPTKNTRAQWKR